MADQPLTDDIGTVYRLTYQDGATALFTEEALTRELREQAQPDRLDAHRVTSMQRFDDARWELDRSGIWTLSGLSPLSGERITLGDATHPEMDTLPMSPVIEAMFHREATTFGQSDESSGDGNTVGSRLEELADRIRDLFSRHRHRDQGMDL